MNIPIVYEDNYLLVADKPAGLLTIPTPKNEPRTLTSILNQDLKDRNIPYRLHPCHRLDRQTSGLIIYAKGKAMQKKVMELFKKQAVKKTYFAFAQKELLKKEGTIGEDIAGQNALTHYKVKQIFKGFSLIEVHPLTGRTNQIRIHFKAIGHPLVGETKYAFRRDFKLKAKRLCLHAGRIEFRHPLTKNNLILEAKLPLDMQEFLAKNG